MDDIEEVIEYKKCFKKLKMYFLIGTIIIIPSWILAFQIQTANYLDIILCLILLIFYIIGFIRCCIQYIKQSSIAENAIYKKTLLGISSEEIISKEMKKEFNYNTMINLNKEIKDIIEVNHKLRIKRKYDIIDFCEYEKYGKHYNSENEIYEAMIIDSSKNTIEKCEKIISEKNKNYNFKYLLTVFDNKLMISIFVDYDFYTLKKFSNPIAEFFKEIILELQF